MEWLKPHLTWKNGQRAALAVLLLLLVIAAFVRIWAMTPMGRSFAEARIEALDIRGQSVEIDGLSGDLLGRFEIGKLTVSDEEGVWLTADDVSVKWSPLSLLSRHADVEKILVRSVSLDRRPVLAEAEDTDSGNESGAGLRVTLEHAAMGRIAIAEGVAGPEGAYTARAALAIGSAESHASVSLTPYNESGDRANIDLRWGEDAPLIGEARIQGDAGGMIASLIGAAEDDDVDISLVAERTYEQWRLTAQALLGEGEFLTLTGREAEGEIDLSGEADLLLLPGLGSISDRAGGPIAFNAVVRPESEPSRLVLSMPNGELNASAQVSTNDGETTLEDFSAELDRLNAPEALSSESLSLETIRLAGTLTRSSEAVRFEGTAALPSAAYGDRSAKDILIDGTFGYTDGLVSMDFGLKAEQLEGLPDAAQPYLADTVEASVDGRYRTRLSRLEADRFSISSGSTRLRGAGSFDLDGPVALAGRLSTQRPGDGQGKTSLRWSVDGDWKGAVSGDLNGDVQYRINDEELAAIAGETFALDIDFERSADGALALPKADISSETLTLTGTGSVSGERISGAFDFSLLGGVYQGAAFDTLEGKADLSGSPDAPAVNATLKAGAVSYSGRTLDAPALSFEMNTGRAMTGRADFAATLEGQPLTLTAEGFRTDETFSVQTFDLGLGEARLTGEATGPIDDPGATTILLELDGASPVGGTLDGAVAWRAGLLDADIQTSGLTYAGLNFDAVTITADGAWPVLNMKMEAAGDTKVAGLVSPFIFNPDGVIDFSARRADMSLTASLGEAALSTQRPASVDFSDGLTLDAALNLLGGAADIQLNRKSDTPASLDVTLSNLSMQQAGGLIGRGGLRGETSGALSLRDENGRLEGAASLAATDLSRAGRRSAAANLNTDILLDDERLSLSWRATDEAGALDLSGALNLPVTTQAETFSLRTNPGAPATLEVNGEGAIGPLMALIAPADLRLEGDILIDASYEGALSDFRPSGRMSLANGVIEDGLSGLVLEKLALSADFDREAVRVESVRASGGRGGSVSGAGDFAYDGSAAIALKLNKLDAFRRPDIRAALSGEAALAREGDETRITGGLTINEARINTDELSGGSYATLDVRFDTPGAPPPEEAEIEQRGVMLDVSLAADRRVFVEGSGLNTEWGVDMKVTGLASAPRLSGNATMVRGEADLIGRRFRLSEGELIFDGPPDETRLRLEAMRESGGVTTRIGLSGPALSPEIELSSSPELPEDEVLSRAIFGKSPSQLSAFETAQLALAAAQLAGGGGGAIDLTSPLRDAAGLDTLDFAVDETGGATVATGKYLADDVFLEIETGQSGAPGVSVEWTPLNNVEIGATADPTLGPRLEVKWKRDFDRLPFTGGGSDIRDETPAESGEAAKAD